MDRKIFESGLQNKKEEMQNEAHEEALTMDKKRDNIIADIATKKSELSEIEGKPESAISSQRERSSAEKEMVKQWENFLKEYFPEKKFDLSDLEIPQRTLEEEKEFTRLQFRTGKLLAKELFQKGKELYNSADYTDGEMDKLITEAVGDSFIWVRDNEAADEKLKNKSADMIDQEGLATETLNDRLLHELKFFKETGEHLDKNTGTITSSRGSGGHAFIVYWDGVKLEVDRRNPDNPHDDWRPRQEVSSRTKSEK